MAHQNACSCIRHIDLAAIEVSARRGRPRHSHAAIAAAEVEVVCLRRGEGEFLRWSAAVCPPVRPECVRGTAVDVCHAWPPHREVNINLCHGHDFARGANLLKLRPVGNDPSCQDPEQSASPTGSAASFS